MNLIWAPWRAEYIHGEKPKGCFLCAALKKNNDENNHILLHGQWNFVIMNKYPYVPGHILVAPCCHVGDLDELPPKELHEHVELVAKCIKVLKQTFAPTGFNIGVNIGNVAGAANADHIHTHVVPRWEGDSDCLPIMGNFRVVPEGLTEIYQKLKGKF